MKIGVDIRTTAGEKAGKGWYTFHIVKNLLTLDTKNTYILYTKNAVPGFDDFKNARQKIITSGSLLWHYKVIQDCKKENVDLFFAPTSFIVPAFLPGNIKSIVTVHDIVAFLFPKNHNKKAVFIERLLLKRALKKATRILAVSQNTKNDLSKKFKIPSEKIDVVYCAGGEEFKLIKKEELSDFITKTNLPPKFFLAVGSVIPRKNYKNLLKAFAMVSQRYPHYHLIIVGAKGWKTDEIDQVIRENYLQNKVHMLGYLSTTSLINLYNLASAFVFPSFYEGFGIPVLEAMQCGCPVIASRTSSIPEVAGKCAVFCDPESIDEIALSMEQVIRNPSLCDKLREEGLKQVLKFDWKISAGKVLDILKKTDIL